MERWKKEVVKVQAKIESAHNSAESATKRLFPEGTKFDMGNHRYKVIGHESNEHRRFGLDLKNVKNLSTRPIDVLNEIDRIENISIP